MKYGYHSEDLTSIHNCDFMENEKFLKAYNRGRQTLDMLHPGMDYKWYWRVLVGLWVAKNCTHVEGDFIECGVATGFMSSSICQYVDWNSLSKKFYLIDTFQGMERDQITEEEVKLGRLNFTWYDKVQYEKVISNFSEWKDIYVIKGRVPEAFSNIILDKLSYVHLDMNSSIAEKDAFLHLYDKVSKGGHILLDDYGYNGFAPTKRMFDELAEKLNFNILCLPTGQGLIIKNK